MTDLSTWLQTDTTRDLSPDVTFVDADTVRDSQGSVRLQGLDAPEVDKLLRGDDGTVRAQAGQVGGQVTADQVAKLAKEMGFTHVQRSGEKDPFGRDIGDLINPQTGESFRTRLLQEGIVSVHGEYDVSGLQEIADYGALLRTNKDNTSKEWEQARQLIEDAVKQDGKSQGHFRIAQAASGDWQRTVDYWVSQGLSKDAAEARADDIYNKDVALLRQAGVDVATGDSTNPLSDAWDVGLIGVQESMWGLVDLFGEQIDSEYLTTVGQTGVQRARNRIVDRGDFIKDYKDVDGFWEALQYVGNNAALSLPYMGITVAATLAAPVTGGLSLTAPAAVYAGQTWNEMEGEKNAAVAIGAGVAQAALDRLGIGLIFKGVNKAPKDMLRAGIDKLVADGMTREAATATVMAATRKELAGFAGDAAKVAADQLKAKALFKSMSSRLLTGASGEAATEALQESTAYLGATLGSDKVFDWNELNERQLQALVAGGTLGGAFSVPGAAYDAGAWADVAVRQAPADAQRLSLAGKFADEERAEFGRIASIQENAAAASSRAKAAGPQAHPTLEERADVHKKSKKDRSVGEKIVDGLHAAPSLWQGSVRYIFQPEILERSRTARIMADMFGGQLQRTFHGSNYENSKHHRVSIYRNMLPSPTNFWKSRGIRSRKKIAQASHDMYQAMNAAIDPKTKELDMEKIPEDIRPLVQQMLQLGDKMHADQKAYNPELGYQKNYLIRYKSFDKNKIHNNKQGFASLLQSEFGFSRSEAIELANKITDSSEVNDFADILDGAAAAGKPGHHKERTLNLSENPKFQEFMEQDLFANIANAAKSAARYTTYMEFVGENNSILNQLLAEMQRDGLAPEEVNKIASQMQDYLAAESGNYKRAESAMGKRLERVQRNLMAWMTVAGLPLATISSFVEAALTTKGLTKGEIFGPIRKQGEDVGKAMWDKFGEAVEYDDKLDQTTPAIAGQNVLDKLGFNAWDVGSASTTSTATRVGATEVNDINNKFMEFYFKSIGLTQWTNFTRLVRASFAGDFLMTKLQLIANADPESKTNEVQEAEEQLRNYGVDVDTAIQRYLEGQPLDEAQLREFQFNWINDAVVLPQSANRPLIYQDPRFALFTQFQGFIATFTANQIPKLWGEYVKRGTPAMKYNAFATMATMIMLGFASQYLKDLLKYGEARRFGPDDHPYLNTSEYLQRGVRASGLLGTGERVLDQFFPIYEQRSDNAGEWLFNTTTGESPALGFAKRAISGTGSLIEGDVGRGAKELTRTVPWIGPINFLRDEAGKAGAHWNFKGE